MSRMMQLSNGRKSNIECKGNFSDDDILKRHKEYFELTDDDFRKKYRHLLFKSAYITIYGVEYPIQMNFCNNVFCKWYGLPQVRYVDVKNKPSRYKLHSSNEDSSIVCNDIPSDKSYGIVLGNETNAVSNYSLAEEIKRLIDINTVEPIVKEYNFHYEGCVDYLSTPFSDKDLFKHRGKSTSKSIKYQCKACGKITNVLPSKKSRLNYNHKRSAILVRFTKDLVGRTPVRSTCEQNGIGHATYYRELERLYLKCLEFLQHHETLQLRKMDFAEMFIDTDSMIYNLNNIRKKGFAKAKDKQLKTDKELGVEPQDVNLQTYLIASADMLSGYVFRADIAYDYGMILEEVESDTETYHCDHTYDFLRKNDRLRYSYSPQPPTQYDSETEMEYQIKHQRFENRKKYVDGCHTKTLYTAMAQYWLIKNSLNAKCFHFLSDDDATLQNAVFRVFADKFKDGFADYFTIQVNRVLSITESGTEFFRFRKEIRAWGRSKGLDVDAMPYEELAYHWLLNELQHHEFYKYQEIDGKPYPVRGNNKIRHPLVTKDEGERLINCISDLTYMDKSDLAKLILKLNSRSINNFFQKIRRSICILERPFHTSRADGKSYIYANYNPRYAQYATTILRTFYNFCWATKMDGETLTPAQRLGIADRVYDYQDIIYFGR